MDQKWLALAKCIFLTLFWEYMAKLNDVSVSKCILWTLVILSRFCHFLDFLDFLSFSTFFSTFLLIPVHYIIYNIQLLIITMIETSLMSDVGIEMNRGNHPFTFHPGVARVSTCIEMLWFPVYSMIYKYLLLQWFISF